MAGLITYIAVFFITGIWILGWTGISVVTGMFFDLPMKSTGLIGATLGPLGFLLTLMVGILERKSRRSPEVVPASTAGVLSANTTQQEWDPFA